MKCEHCGKRIEHPIQESKEDYWLCSCGDYHKNRFPYTCPVEEIKRDIQKIWNESSSYRDFKEYVFRLVINQSK